MSGANLVTGGWCAANGERTLSSWSSLFARRSCSLRLNEDNSSYSDAAERSPERAKHGI